MNNSGSFWPQRFTSRESVLKTVAIPMASIHRPIQITKASAAAAASFKSLYLKCPHPLISAPSVSLVGSSDQPQDFRGGIGLGE